MDPIPQSILAVCIGALLLAVGKGVEKWQGPDGGGPAEWSTTDGGHNVAEVSRLVVWNMRRFKWMGYFFMGWPIYVVAAMLLD